MTVSVNAGRSFFVPASEAFFKCLAKSRIVVVPLFFVLHKHILPPSYNILGLLLGLFQVKLFLALTNNISKNNLFQTKNITCYNSWFHDESTNIIFYVIGLYDYLRLTLRKSKCSYILRQK